MKTLATILLFVALSNVTVAQTEKIMTFCYDTKYVYRLDKTLTEHGCARFFDDRIVIDYEDGPLNLYIISISYDQDNNMYVYTVIDDDRQTVLFYHGIDRTGDFWIGLSDLSKENLVIMNKE